MLLAFVLGLAVFGLLAILWFIPQVLLIAFASILVAVLLTDASRSISRWLHLPHGAALAVVLFGSAAVVALGAWLLAPRVLEQTSMLADELPRALQRVRDWVERQAEFRRLAESLPPAQRMFNDLGAIFSRARLIFSGLLGGIGNTVIVVFLSIYFAAQPSVYTGAVIRLLPQQYRQRGQAVLRELGLTLGLWLRGKLLSMAVVGIATAAGLAILGVPLAIPLGTLTGLLGFIPYLGPVIGAVPAMLIAFTQGPIQAVYVALLFAGVQAVEGYLLQPLVERKTVSLPPALTILMQLMLGLAFGLVGVALATPFAAVLAVLIATLYVQDVLHDDIVLPSEKQ